MKIALLNMRVCGFKNIDTPIDIQFANKTIDKSIFTKPHVKAIYGTNGMGKSAIVFAMNTYYNTVLDPTFLPFESARGDLGDMINKKIKKAFIDLYFAVQSDKGNYNIIHHYISYSLKYKEVIIDKEHLSIVKGDTWGNINNEDNVFITSNNKIDHIHDGVSQKLNDTIIDKTKNLISSSSVLVLCLSGSDSYDPNNKNDTIFNNAIYCALVFVLGLNIFIDEKDSHRISASKVKLINESSNKEWGFLRKEFVIDDEIDEIDAKDLEKYKVQMKKICKFIQIFKPNLNDIEIDDRPTQSGRLRCKKTFVYDNDVRIDSKYESSGIKKLIKLYPVLNSTENGGITFIDEFDSNIHDVYLCKLVEYFVTYGNGQLIFTTHNLGPMEVLANTDEKHSIDFINNSKISHWIRNGNYSVVNVYRSGLIKNCPFNIDSADFTKTFGE